MCICDNTAFLNLGTMEKIIMARKETSTGKIAVPLRLMASGKVPFYICSLYNGPIH